MTRRSDTVRSAQVPAPRPPAGQSPVVEVLRRPLAPEQVDPRQGVRAHQAAPCRESVLVLPSPIPNPTGATPTPTPSPTPSTSAPFPTSVAFKSADPSPIIRAEAIGGAVNGRLYVFGGFNDQGSPDTSIPHSCERRLRPDGAQRQAAAPAGATCRTVSPTPRALVIGNPIWFVGGYQGNHPGPGETSRSGSTTRPPNLGQRPRPPRAAPGRRR